MHKDCVHVRCGHGAIYCPKTRLVYIRVDLLPTPNKARKRPDDSSLFFRACQNIQFALKNAAPIFGFLWLKDTLPLPEKEDDFLSPIEFVRYLRDNAIVYKE